MYKKLFTYTLLIIATINSLYGQDYPASAISDKLKENANAVIRDLSINYIQSDANNAVYIVNKVVTVLNNKGNYNAQFTAIIDKTSDLNKFSGILRDASGKIIKKIKKGDLVYSSLEFDSFTTGSYKIYYECLSPSYPFTIEYNYEIKNKNGICAYPHYRPIATSNLSVEKTSYKIEAPTNIQVRHYANYGCKITENSINGKKIYEIRETDIPALIEEPWQPQGRELYPSVIFAPSDFCYDSHCGNMDSWKSYGAWVYKLLEGRDNLPTDMVLKLKDMVSTAKDDYEKVKILYEYLQKNTRYISIQLGIGGFQPETAANVIKTKMGDCKGLTNLMKAMLKTVDIESNYCEIHNGKTHQYLHKDFPSLDQTNHVILLVPLKNDSIWLECTSPTLPFGFVHSGISDHDILIITPEGGKLCHIPAYEDNYYRSIPNLTINIDDNGNATGLLQIDENMDAAVYTSLLKEQNRENQIKYLMNEIKMPKVQFGDINIAYTPSSRPETRITCNFEASDIVNKTGNRMFTREYPLNRGNFRRFVSNERLQDIEVPRQYIYSDSIKYVLPEGYVAESLPKDLNIENEFGSLVRKLSSDGNTVNSELFIKIKHGKYDKSTYNDLKAFFKEIDSVLATRLVFRKN